MNAAYEIIDIGVNLTHRSFQSDQKEVIERAMAAANQAAVIACIREEFPQLAFYPAEDFGGDVEDVEVQDVTLHNVRVIALEEPNAPQTEIPQELASPHFEI